MTYPESIDNFTEKLNKNQDGNPYVIEEEVAIENGIYDGVLAHDNINNETIKVYTGEKLTGNEIKNFIISIPETTPWCRNIKIFS
ncbi:MAG: phosphoglucomutase, partial [Clostridia bacterium]|nr:phosphoglucomutase [Clostridia bacterium]